jgi:hypothetical protein
MIREIKTCLKMLFWVMRSIINKNSNNLIVGTIPNLNHLIAFKINRIILITLILLIITINLT